MTKTRNGASQVRTQAAALRRWIVDGEADGLAEAGFDYDRPADEIVLGGERSHDPTGRQSRANSASLETGGGYTVASIMADAIDVQMRFFAAVRQLATIVTTEKGGPLLYPIVQDVDNEGVLIPENSLVGTLDVEQFGQVKLFPHKIGSRFLMIPNELLDDAPEALASFLGRVLGDRCGRGANRQYTNTLLAHAPVAVTTASQTIIAGDEIEECYYAVDPSYRDAPSAGWLANSSILQYIRLLKDSSGRYLFRKGRKAGSPDTLLGKPILFNMHMAATPTAGTVSALFGDLSKVLIRDVGGVRIKRADERWADLDQSGIAGYLRTSCAILDAGGKPIQALMQHS